MYGGVRPRGEPDFRVRCALDVDECVAELGEKISLSGKKVRSGLDTLGECGSGGALKRGLKPCGPCGLGLRGLAWPWWLARWGDSRDCGDVYMPALSGLDECRETACSGDGDDGVCSPRADGSGMGARCRYPPARPADGGVPARAVSAAAVAVMTPASALARR